MHQLAFTFFSVSFAFGFMTIFYFGMLMLMKLYVKFVDIKYFDTQSNIDKKKAKRKKAYRLTFQVS
jgi:hypothetical protein